MTDDSFADAPPTVTELRACRDRECDQWTPRDTLVHLLRKVDRGEIELDTVVVAFRDKKNREVGYARSAPDNMTTLGLLDWVAGMLRQDALGVD